MGKSRLISFAANGSASHPLWSHSAGASLSLRSPVSCFQMTDLSTGRSSGMFQSITTGVGRYIELSVAKSRIPPLSCSGDNCEHTDHRGYHKSHPCGKVRFAADSALEEDGFKLSGSRSRDRQTVMGRPDGRLENGGGTVEEPKVRIRLPPAESLRTLSLSAGCCRRAVGRALVRSISAPQSPSSFRTWRRSSACGPGSAAA